MTPSVFFYLKREPDELEFYDSLTEQSAELQYIYKLN